MIYRIARATLRLALQGFFRHVEVQGDEVIPMSGPVLFVSNHTNAFVDPLVVLTGVDRRVTLTAKRTLSRNPLLFPLIKALGVVLLHRRQDAPDGTGSSDNIGALSQCVSVLRDGGAVFVFPEGMSHSDPGMRPFKTGAARIVIDYLAADSGEELQIVPVGLHFDKKDRWRSRAAALIGEPVAAGAWLREHLPEGESPRAGARKLTDAMRSWVEELTLNFSTDEERALLFRAERLLAYEPEGPEPLDRRPALDARQRVSRVHRLQRGAHVLRQHDPDEFAAVAADAESIDSRLVELGVKVEEVSLSMHPARAALFVVRELEVLLFGAPLALAAWLTHLPPLTLTRWMVAKMSEDEDHPASNAVFLSIPIFVSWWIAAMVTITVFSSLAWALLGVGTAIFAGVVHLHYRDRAGGVLKRIRTFLLWSRRPSLRRELKAAVEDWHQRIGSIDQELFGSLEPDEGVGR